jgi:hypothetical protein
MMTPTPKGCTAGPSGAPLGVGALEPKEAAAQQCVEADEARLE